MRLSTFLVHPSFLSSLPTARRLVSIPSSSCKNSTISSCWRHPSRISSSSSASLAAGVMLDGLPRARWRGALALPYRLRLSRTRYTVEEEVEHSVAMASGFQPRSKSRVILARVYAFVPRSVGGSSRGSAMALNTTKNVSKTAQTRPNRLIPLLTP
jgi:hypothetical protein